MIRSVIAAIKNSYKPLSVPGWLEKKILGQLKIRVIL
jgi:hypothetical protein